MKFTTILLLFFIIGSILIIGNHRYNLKKNQDRLRFAKDVANWITNVGKSFYNVTMYAIKKPWLPENLTVEQSIHILKNISKNVINNNSINLENKSIN